LPYKAVVVPYHPHSGEPVCLHANRPPKRCMADDWPTIRSTTFLTNATKSSARKSSFSRTAQDQQLNATTHRAQGAGTAALREKRALRGVQRLDAGVDRQNCSVLNQPCFFGEVPKAALLAGCSSSRARSPPPKAQGTARAVEGECKEHAVLGKNPESVLAPQHGTVQLCSPCLERRAARGYATAACSSHAATVACSSRVTCAEGLQCWQQQQQQPLYDYIIV
jgi:hypothetical protein